VVGEVAAVVLAGHHAAPAGPGTDAEKYPWPEVVTEIAATAGPAPPAEPLDDYPLLPRRRRVSRLPDAARDPAELPGPMDDGPALVRSRPGRTWTCWPRSGADFSTWPDGPAVPGASR